MTDTREPLAELETLRAAYDKAMCQNADSAALMEAYRDLVLIWITYDRKQPASALIDQLEARTRGVVLNNAGVATLNELETLRAENARLLAGIKAIHEHAWRAWSLEITKQYALGDALELRDALGHIGDLADDALQGKAVPA